MQKLKTFRLGNEVLAVQYLNTEQVKEGVECDIYSFAGDTTKDLAIVRVKPSYKTPLQKIVKGDETTEGYVQGQGRLTVKRLSGETKVHLFAPGEANNPVIVNVGEHMQWEASGEDDLTFYEVCTPPYEDGRFENIG